jgi:hypothetical protein
MKEKLTLTLILLVSIGIQALAQEPVKPRPSPLAVINMRYKDAYVKITYGQPHKQGREIFGKLVPYGKVWRTGANEATEITVTKNVEIAGHQLKAGTYSIFTIPEKEKWTIIINADVGLWGAYNYNSQQDVFRFDIPVNTLSGVVYEPFTMQFDQKNEVANLLMMWDRTQVSIPIKFLN